MTITDPAALHRRQYCDLIRAQLRRRGWSQRQLAAALGVSEPYVHDLLDGSGDPRWRDKTKTPSLDQADRIARLVCDDREQRERILHYVRQVRRHIDLERRREGVLSSPAALSGERVGEVIADLYRLHELALFTRSPEESRGAYARLFQAGAAALRSIDPRRYPRARVLAAMYLHDAECALDRSDLALYHAREARAILGAHGRDSTEPSYSQIPSHQVDYQELIFRSAKAEIVALNNLSLPEDALDVADRVMYSGEAKSFWLPQISMDRLSSLRRTKRFNAVVGERIHGEAMERTRVPILEVMLDNRLAEFYISHGKPRSLKKAEQLIEVGLARAERAPYLGALHRVRVMRTAVDYLLVIGDRRGAADLAARAFDFARSAGLTHQCAEMRDEYGDVLPEGDSPGQGAVVRSM